MLIPPLVKRHKTKIIVFTAAVLLLWVIFVQIIGYLTSPCFFQPAYYLHCQKDAEKGKPHNQNVSQIFLDGWTVNGSSPLIEDYLSYAATYKHIPSWRIGEYTNHMTGYEKAVFAVYFRHKIFGISIYNVPTELKPGDDLIHYCGDDIFKKAIVDAEYLDHEHLAESLIKEFNIVDEGKYPYNNDATKIRNLVKFSPSFEI